jgi:lipase
MSTPTPTRAGSRSTICRRSFRAAVTTKRPRATTNEARLRLNVHEWGDPRAARVVCLHGVQAHGGRFRRLAEERLGRFHVLAPDLRGHGRSGWEGPWTLDVHLADLVETFPDPAAWIGHSFGGRLVLELAAERPDLVEQGVLLDPAIVFPADYTRFLAEEELASDISFESLEAAIDAAVLDFPKTPREIIEEEVRAHLERHDDTRWRWRYSREAVAAGYLSVAAPPPAFVRLRAPILVVAGAQSKFVSVGEAELFGAALGDRFELVVVPGGHRVLWDAFNETADAIDRFLAR